MTSALLLRSFTPLLLSGALLGCSDSEPTAEIPLDHGPPPVTDVELPAPMLPSRAPLPPATQATKEANPPVPSEPGPLFAFLTAQNYRTFPVNAEVVTSPAHGAGRTFLNPVLAASVRAENPSHPAGSAAVKELFNANGDLFGWTVMIKTTTENGDGNDWFWYEVHSITDGTHPIAKEAGAGRCVRCHTPAVDFIHPLPEPEPPLRR